MEKRLEDVHDFFYSKIVSYELDDKKVEVNLIPTSLSDIIDVSIKHSSIVKLRLDLREKVTTTDHYMKIVIFISNVFGFDGYKMRKDLLSIGIKNYKKTKEDVWMLGLCHVYSINFNNVTDLEGIFKIFNYYLPK